MIIYPAIDLRQGKVVRLREGDPHQQTIFSDNPLAIAQQWAEQGAEWLHLINLDGAFNEANNHLDILERIAMLNIRVQFGGGLRDMKTIQLALKLGASRVILGTAALENPKLVEEALDQFGPEAICIALDARDGKIATHGWTEISDETPISFGQIMAQKGVRYALYTDVRRDGSLIGVNVNDTIALARQTSLSVIASGGVSHMSEIHQLARSRVINGAIIGMALYEGKITLAEALLAAKVSDTAC